MWKGIESKEKASGREDGWTNCYTVLCRFMNESVAHVLCTLVNYCHDDILYVVSLVNVH